MFSWLFFERYLFSERAGSLVKRIAWLSISSMTVAIMSFILVLSIMAGLHKNINLRILALEPHLSMEFDKDKTEESILSHPSIKKINSLSKISETQLFDRQDVILRTVDGIFHGAVARGVTEKTLNSMVKRLEELPQQSGNFHSIALEIPEEDEVVIGSSLAKQMNLYEGDYATILPPEALLMAPGENPQFSKVMVKQIISTNVHDLDSQMVLYQRGKALLNFSRTGSRTIGVEVWLKDPYDASSIKESLGSFKEVKVETWRERNSAIFQALKLEKLMLGSFLGLSALITTFSIWSVLSLLIAQKKKEMGLLMAIGFSRKQLRDLFQKLGLYLAGIGLGVGVVLGVLISLYIEKYPLKILPDIYYDSEVPAKVEFNFISFVLIITILFIFLAIRLTMKRILSLKPSEALRASN